MELKTQLVNYGVQTLRLVKFAAGKAGTQFRLENLQLSGTLYTIGEQRTVYQEVDLGLCFKMQQ